MNHDNFWKEVGLTANLVIDETLRRAECTSHDILFKVYEVPGDVLRIDIPLKEVRDAKQHQGHHDQGT